MPNRLRLCFAWLFVFLILSTARLQAGQNVWTPVGPDGGKVTAVAVHPSTPRIVYAATEGGGVFKSIDGGRTWFAANNGLFSLFIRDLVIDPQTPETLYLAAGDLLSGAGIYKTTDGGGTWRDLSRGLPTPPPFCGCGSLRPIADLAIDPRTPRILYAVAGGSVYKTEGGGWFFAGSGLPENGTLTVEVAPSAPNVVYAGTTAGVYKSANRGATWSVSTTGVGTQPVRALAIHPRDERTVYAGTDPNGVFKSTNGGESWAPASRGLLNRQVFALALDPSNPATLWAGTGQSVYKSTDAAGNWRQVATGVPPSPIGAIAVAPSNSSVLYAGPGEVPWVRSATGIFKSTDRGETWSVFNQGMKASIVNSLAPAGAPGALFAGTAGGGVLRTDDGGATWQPRNAGRGPHAQDVLSVTVDPTDPSVVYAGLGGGAGLQKSVDGGASWTLAAAGLTIPATSNALVSVEDLAIDPENPSILFAAGSGGFYKSTDGAATWRQIITLLRESLSVAIAPSDPSVIYAGGGSAFRASFPPDPTLFRSRDGGATWETLSSIQSLVYALAVDPRDPDTVYAGITGGVARSTDGGDTWTRLSVGTGANAETLEIDPVDPDVLYAGTREGVFRSPDRGTTWRSYSQGLQNRRVLDILIDPLAPGTIYAATHGGGVLRLDRTPCVPGENVLCLQEGRFRVTVAWTDFQAVDGVGHAVPLTSDTGAFWFFGPQNLELMVKVIDGRAVNQRYWVFFGALTNVQYTLTVTDIESGQVKTYFNPSGRFASLGDTAAFFVQEFVNPGADAAADEVPAGPVTSPAGACAPGDTALCLQGGRFRVEVAWEDFAGSTGAGHAVPLTLDTGAFWFFGPSNLELMIKVVDGRAVNGKHWVFYGALTNVGYTIRVTDTATGAVRTYTNPKGTFASAGDTQAF